MGQIPRSIVGTNCAKADGKISQIPCQIRIEMERHKQSPVRIHEISRNRVIQCNQPCSPVALVTEQIL